jgi:hypothetical protein
MDEFTLLLVAKLKADQRKVEREQREQLAVLAPQPPRHEAVTPRDLRGRRTLWSKFELGEQS